MNIVHIVDDLSPANTGITSAVRELSRAGIGAGWSVAVISVGPDADWSVSGLRPQSARIRGAGPVARWRYAPGFDDLLHAAAGKAAVIHIHGLWFYPQWRAAQIANRRRWPMVVSPHNMLGGWLWRRGHVRRLKKAIYFKSLLERPLSNARAVHALSDDESARIARFLPGPRRVTVPNALDLAAVDGEIAMAGSTSVGADKYVLFLGRIHPVKGLDLLIESTARTQGFRVILAGPPEDAAHERFLRDRIRALGLEERVSFIGPVHGPDKWRLLAGAWVLCAPSHSEGMGMAALEAMAARVPVITTPTAGFADMQSAGGMLVRTDAVELGAALEAATQWSLEERTSRGRLARSAVESRYSWPKVWPLYEQLYRSAAAGLQ